MKETRPISNANAVILTVAGLSLINLPILGQIPASALMNQESEEALEAARAASPHTAESTLRVVHQGMLMV